MKRTKVVNRWPSQKNVVSPQQVGRKEPSTRDGRCGFGRAFLSCQPGAGAIHLIARHPTLLPFSLSPFLIPDYHTSGTNPLGIVSIGHWNACPSSSTECTLHTNPLLASFPSNARPGSRFPALHLNREPHLGSIPTFFFNLARFLGGW
jgi:hypothetical protein